MEADILEKAHKTNIERLTEEFGKGKKDEILYIYENKRAESESDAKVNDYVPIFLYRAVRDVLRVNNQ